MQLRRLSTRDAGFDSALAQLLAFESAQDPQVDATVAGILADVKARGDAAVLEYTRRFDKVDAKSLRDLELTRETLQGALNGLTRAPRAALEAAAARVTAYHERQKSPSWDYTDADGTRLGQQITPLDRVGIYVPGGKAAYPSSVLMNALPARVAGVGEVIMVVPTPGGEQNKLVLAAAALAGVDRVFTIGGAQAVGALAYGTETVPAVDKIVGPGNAYVAAAKRRVFGVVGIDMVAMDLFSQAEHDEIAQAILLSPDAGFIAKVEQAIAKLLPAMPRRDVIQASLAGRGALIQTRDLDEACAIANRIAPEHLELSVAEPRQWLAKIRHAGAIFLGRYTSESLGDYCAGPNHVLPTSRTARFSSPLGVYDFQKRSSVIEVSAQGARTLGAVASELARGEGLAAHAQAAELRMK
jgi:histidinol dehydrogenase